MACRPPPRRSKRIANYARRAISVCPAPTPTLLDLPPELRIVIFECALGVDGEIPVTADTKLPALFATSQQIRQETMPIWYGKNSFDFSIVDCDASLVHKFYQGTAFQQYHVRGNQSLFTCSGSPSWKNLLDWSRVLHQGETLSIKAMELEEELAQEHPLTSIIAAVHEVCLESIIRGESWTQCEQTLSSLRRVAVFQDRRWPVD